MFIQVHEVTTEAERQAIYRFRYWIYAVELGKDLPGMDHGRGIMRDELDEEGSLLAAVDQDTGHLVGTCRGTRLSRPFFPERLKEELALGPMIEALGGDAISYSSAFMVDPAYRGRTVASLLAGTQYQIGLRRGMRVGVMMCELGLLRLYYQVGYRPFTQPIRPYERAGLRMPLALVLRDRAYFQQLSSPLAPFLSADGDDGGETAGQLRGLYPGWRDVPHEPMERRALWAAIAHSAPSEQDANVFTGFDEGEIGYFLDRFAMLQLPQGEAFYQAGESHRGLAVVLSGALGVTLESAADPHYLAVLKPGDVVGDVGGLSDLDRAENVVALQDAEMLLLPEDIQERLERKDLSLAYRFSRNLNRLLGARLQAVNHKLSGQAEVSHERFTGPATVPAEAAAERDESYSFATLEDREQELQRLERQAEIGWALEHYWLKKLGFKGEGTVLDLGSGPGVIATLMARAYPRCQVVGVEPEDALRERAAARAADRDLADRCTFMSGTGEALPLGDRSVDACYCRFLFQHLADPAAVMAELLRVLKPGGTVVTVDVDDEAVVVHPEPDGLRDLQARAAEAQARLGGDRHVGRKLVDLLQAAGFEAARTEVAPLTSHHIPVRFVVEAMFGFKTQTLGRADLALPDDDETLVQLRALADEPGAWIFAPIFFSHARAPRR